MSDYRDDRAALRERVRSLETELEIAQSEQERLRKREQEAQELLQENARLMKECEALKLEAKVSPLARQRPLFIAGVVVSILIAGVVVAALADTAERPKRTTLARLPPVPPEAGPKPVPTRTTPIAAVRSKSCRCAAEGDLPTRILTLTPGGEMSFGENRTHFAKFGFDVEGEVMSVSMDVGRETVPPSRVEGGMLHMLMACIDDRVVFAQGQRITAWAWETGRVLWNTTLPEPVGNSENGALAAECTPMEIKQGYLQLPTPGGVVPVALADGARMK
ncbi:MAG TPA: hypothetical protein PKA88_02630 [Polyangiaceae bacterium]|nr:hypothetical protein [Polyangiaceae bacterium]HMR73450.1 hypothetical protein [Polyangiaceae bacterium]